MEELKKQAVPEYPYTKDGWAKHLSKHFEVAQMKSVLALHESGFLEEAITAAINNTDKIDFELFWEAFSFKRGPKAQTQKLWMQLSYNTQRLILDEALPKYNRFILVSGIQKCQPIVYLRQRRYKNEIPDQRQIEKFANTVNRYFNEVINWKAKYSSYVPPTKESLLLKTEAFMYRYPDMTPIEVCGVLRWMAKTWDVSYRHLIKPTQAMSISTWTKYFMHANDEIQRLKQERQRYVMEKLEQKVVQDLPFEGTDELDELGDENYDL